MARHDRRGKPLRGEVGVIVAIGASGRLTVRAPSSRIVPEGTDLVDRTGRVHGEVLRVFGPVERPYYSVRIERMPRPQEGAELVGASLFVEEGASRAPG